MAEEMEVKENVPGYISCLESKSVPKVQYNK